MYWMCMAVLLYTIYSFCRCVCLCSCMCVVFAVCLSYGSAYPSRFLNISALIGCEGTEIPALNCSSDCHWSLYPSLWWSWNCRGKWRLCKDTHTHTHTHTQTVFGCGSVLDNWLEKHPVGSPCSPCGPGCYGKSGGSWTWKAGGWSPWYELCT